MNRDHRTDADLVQNYRGLMLAFCLDVRSVALLLGCDLGTANRFQADARVEFEGLRIRIKQARAVNP